ITNLDAEDVKAPWSSPDFVKLDAEGEEARILAGGARFFERHSPLVMFEIKHQRAANLGLAEAFRGKGYGLFRLLDGAPLLGPSAGSEPLDAYELNLFAAKPDRAAELAAAGLLVTEPADWRPDPDAWPRARKRLSAQAFAAAFPAVETEEGLDPDHRLA